jgi:hypothetical protein
MDDLGRAISELDILSIVVVLCALSLAAFWILMPFLVCAVQRSISSCRRELRALNSKLEQILRTIEVQPKVSTDLSDSETTNSITTNGKALRQIADVAVPQPTHGHPAKGRM